MTESLPVSPPTGPRAPAMLFAATLTLAAFHVVGAIFVDGFALDLGSLNAPTPRYTVCVAFWMLFGALSAALFALAVSRRFESAIQIDKFIGEWNALSERRF